ncbi:DUF3099 domain-containing protein [Luteipulveratus sp. YIM 133132]|uniref:DUF3099 domain-containing protein n=1 Tax=Luteipulveratus flavus TaxID=3031728 RepID=A0ABT6C563_9MICO|nr:MULTISPECIES: DUF3099 domain-containing protein [unclassified Luteipulveratus]MDE9364481.1 DUF3099 domain-containing protein [Luteipulveratus sp. YIM 133132]MDF8264020.1 DUF3099 domain-containing protein [Luteipulveratus sp. YIM 133296]
MSRNSRHDDVVPSATMLPVNPQDDHRKRMRNYLISMGIRTVCFVLAVVFTGPLRWICVGFAVILPYVAVVAANATQQRRIDVIGAVTPDDPPPQIDRRHDDSEHHQK